MSEQRTAQAIGGTAKQFDIWRILTLAIEGKIDTLDMRIINAMVADCTAGSRRLAKTLSQPAATVRYRIVKLRALFA